MREHLRSVIPHKSRCLRSLTIALLLVGVVDCGSSPTAPSGRILQGPGRYWLELIGFAISGDPEIPPCLPPALAYTATRLRVDVAEERGLWVGRAPSAIGNLELRIRGGEEVIGGVQVSGSIVGTGLDNETGFLPGVTIMFGGLTGGAASVDGLAEPTGRYVHGTIIGDIQYSDSVGNVTKCTTIIWSLQPVPS